MSTEVLGITVLWGAVVGIALAICGVSEGWAHGEANDVKPAWAPFAPGVDLVVDLGWWNMSGSMKSSSLPDSDLELSNDSGVQTLGAFTVLVFLAAAAASLYFVYLLAAKPCGRELELMVAPDSHKTLLLMMYAAASFGAAVLLFSIILYSSLAIGTHKAVKDKTAQLGVDLELWPRPGWAFAGAALAGCCLLASARIFHVLWLETPEGYQRAFRSNSFSFE